MLQRFRTLFNLPSMIRANIAKGEYDLAIREYKKAKSLVLYSHVCHSGSFNAQEIYHNIFMTEVVKLFNVEG
jgi:hypothetical protein